MPAGRPRTVSPPPEELEALGQEMVEWISNNPRCLHITQWYCLEKHITKNAWKAIIQHSEFLPYYEQALTLIAAKYLDKDSCVRDKVVDRWQRVYFGDLRESEDADLDAEAARKAKETQQVNESYVIQHNALMDQLKKAQEALNINKTSIKTDCKS